MTTTNRASRSKLPRERSRGDGGRSEWYDLRIRLREIVDVLDRSGVDPVDGLEQVAQLIYLKRLDEREPANRSSIFPGLAARFRWSHFRNMPSVELQYFVGHHVLAYMASLVNEAPAIADYYRDATLKIEDPGAFTRIVELVDEINFKKLSPDEMGRILEYLLAMAKPSSEFRTPRHVRALMVSLVDPAEGETIYDPACGTAGFLTDAVAYVLAKYSSAPREVPIYGEDWPVGESEHPLQLWKEEGGDRVDRSRLGRLIYGHDISRRMVRIASMNLELQGIGPVNVKRANSLSTFGGPSPEEMAKKFDVILCAPAFGDAPFHDAIRPDLPIHSTRRELLFLEIAMESLAPGGRCAIIVPESLLFSEGSTFVEIRQRLLSAYEVLAVISLPPGVFRPYSTVKTSIIVFRRPVSTVGRTEYVWFYEIKHDGYDLGRLPQPEANDIPELMTNWGRFVASGYGRPPGPEAGNVSEVDVASRCWWALRAAIEENRFDLSSQRYKPKRYELASPTAETQLVRLIEDYKSFAEGAENLRKQMSEGMLPRDWGEGIRNVKLRDLVEVIHGRTPSTTDPSYWGGGVPWASPKDIKRHVIYDTQDHITQSAVEKAGLTVVNPGAVLIVARGMILIHSVPLAVSAVPLVISQDLRALQPLAESGIDAWYLFAYLKSIEDVLLAYAQGTSHGSRSLPQQAILDLAVPVPPAHICAQVGRITQSYLMLAGAVEQLRGDAVGLFPALLSDIFGRGRGTASARSKVKGS